MLNCQFPRALWELAFSYLGISWVSHNSIGNHLLAWEGCFDRKAKKALVLPHIIFWSIWRERNQRVVEGNEMSLERLKDNFIKTLHFWDKGTFACQLLMRLTSWIACILDVYNLLYDVVFASILSSCFIIHIFPYHKKKKKKKKGNLVTTIFLFFFC